MLKRLWILTTAAVLAAAAAAQAQSPESYKLPPREVVDILDHPPTPYVSVSPDHRWVLLMHRSSMPSIEEVSRPMMRLAGQRFDPSTNGPTIARSRLITHFTFKHVSQGGRVPVLTDDSSGRLDFLGWSPDGNRIAFSRTTSQGIELWVASVPEKAPSDDPEKEREEARRRRAEGGEEASAEEEEDPMVPPVQASRLGQGYLNAVMGSPCIWSTDSSALLCRYVPMDRGAPPAASQVPSGPVILESAKGKSQVRTYQDLLEDEHDEELFAHYVSSRLFWVGVEDGQRRPLGEAALYDSVRISPNGRYLLVERIVPPFSRLVPHYYFPRTYQVWDRDGRQVKEVARLPLRDKVPIGGVPTGMRSLDWADALPDTLTWMEALDGGDPRREAELRDKIMMLPAPFDSQPAEMLRTEERARWLAWTQTGAAMVVEMNRRKQFIRSWLAEPGEGGQWDLVKLDERGLYDAYADPGSPVRTNSPSGHSLIMQEGDWILLSGRGASPQGDRPFLDRYNIRSEETHRLFQSGPGTYETVSEVLDGEGTRLITRLETPTDPPNYLLRDLESGRSHAITAFTDPAPEMRQVKKELITYERADGIELSGTLYLPAGYQSGTRLPVVMWAYPREYNDPDIAGQVRGSTSRFTNFRGPSHLFFLTQGYAVLDGPAMPVVGEQGNDTFVEQLVMNAEAAIDKLVEMGVADPDRIGIGGHSYGAFMTANLLAHSDLFRAGIARSGAYNRSLTPFGFQNERRTFWEAPQIYFSMSPFMHAEKLDEPILLIHGQADNNSGTFPIQSERLYHALNGLGGTARLVMLPNESHGYRARESVLHCLAEMIEWFNQYVKEAPRRVYQETQSRD
ncbi:MAG TPA: prolyl oligopeptidase family serine peptidase [Acidobacteriota bacterium]|nr:prolyl oligopeptidase family serine peptidase [Acidobacteriota bacterium]